MKALVYKGPEIVELEDIPQPAPKGDESLVKIHTVGVCGSDFEGWLGKTGRRTPPMAMGHEMSATVEVPAENSSFKKGDGVVIQPKLYCGQCSFCRQGLTNLCPGAEFFGVMTKNGGMAEYLAVPERCLFRFKETLDFQSASMVEPLAVSYRAAYQIPETDLQQADYTLVVGAGTITRVEDIQVATAAGARFLVSPGTPAALAVGLSSCPVPVLPGCATVTEAMALAAYGFTALKFFPAEPSGGAAFLKSLSGPLPGLVFCPTGGIDAAKAPSYLALANVGAVGGSWVVPDDALAGGDFVRITRLAAEARALRP